MKSKLKITVLIAENSIITVLMFFFSLISPYSYEWDETIKQVNSDSVLALFVFWITVLCVITASFLLLKPKNKVVIFWSSGLVAFALFKLVSLIWVKLIENSIGI